MGNSLRRSAISLDTCKPTSNLLKPIPATSAEKNSAVPIIRNATRNPTAAQLPVPFVIIFLIEGKTCSLTELSTKDMKWAAGFSYAQFLKAYGCSEEKSHLKSKFSEMPPIFKYIEVSRDHMKTYAEERNNMNQPRKCLVGSMFGENIMIISPLKN